MRIHASILIERPIAAVFAYVSIPDQLPGWVAGVATADGSTPDRQGVGATLVLHCPGLACSIWEVTAYEPPRTLALRRLNEAQGVEVHWTLEAVPPGGTRVWVEADLATTSFFQPRPIHLEEIGTRKLREDLDLLRSRLEAAAPEGAR